MDQQAVVGRPLAQAGEGLGRLVERPVAAEDVDGVERPGADGVGHGEQLRLAEPEDAAGVELGRHVDVGRAR